MKKQLKKIAAAMLLVMLMLCTALLSACTGKEEPTPASTDTASESTAPESTEEATTKETETEAPTTEEPTTEETTTEEPTSEEEVDNAALSEAAMENFLKKISDGNYVINAGDFAKTTAYSDDLVWFDYKDDDLYSDFVVMSVNNEVFQGFLEDEGIRNVSFIAEGTAFEAAGPKLLNYWLADEVSQGNIYNLFYNDTENPLQFISYDDFVKTSVASFVGYGDRAVGAMHEVYLILDQEDPTTVHIQAEVDDDEVARIYFDDVDIEVTFGDAKSEPRAEAWMKNPVYPVARTEWTEGDLFIFNSVFLPGYGEEAIPFIPSASYALQIDEENFVWQDQVDMRDPHATEEDIENYAGILLENGFEEAVDENGVTWYRRLLREETKCYSSINLEYDDGLNLTARKYYDFPVYEGLDAINEVITANEYPALAETDALTDFTAKDTAFDATESWLYFYDYDIVLYVDAKYSDYDEVMAYLDAYAEDLLKADYYPVYVDDEESEIDHYNSPDDSQSFRYHFDDDDETVTLLYKAEKLVSAEDTEKILTEAGFPEIDLSAMHYCRDLTMFCKIQYGSDYQTALSAFMNFEKQEDAETYLDQLVAELEDNDFYRVPASEVGSNKVNGYYNEEKGLGLAFDFIPGEEEGDPTAVNFDFKVE